ncbi:hypothetical protein LINGRAHAP2_LOCUS36047 [Linum grandiflorum]
MDNQHAPTW